jgi:hypothetical protein
MVMRSCWSIVPRIPARHLSLPAILLTFASYGCSSSDKTSQDASLKDTASLPDLAGADAPLSPSDSALPADLVAAPGVDAPSAPPVDATDLAVSDAASSPPDTSTGDQDRPVPDAPPVEAAATVDVSLEARDAPIATPSDGPSIGVEASAPPAEAGQPVDVTAGPSRVSGTAAAGPAIASAAVTLKDALGAARTTTTASDGSYNIDTTGLTPPFLVQVVTPTTKLYSASANAQAQTTVNITPLTDLIVRSWYAVQGLATDAAFASPATNPAPAPTAAAVVSDVFRKVVQLWLVQAGVTATDFNLISTPFVANGTGLDRVLQQLTVDLAASSVRVTDGTTTQLSTVTYSTSDGSIAISTTTTSTNGATSSLSETVVPATAAKQSDLEGIKAVCAALANTVTSKGAALQGSDVIAYLDPDVLCMAFNRVQYADFLATVFRGSDMSCADVSITSIDSSWTSAKTWTRFLVRQDGQTTELQMPGFSKKVGGQWLISGDQRLADINAGLGLKTWRGAQSWTGLILGVGFEAPHGAFTGGTVTGGPWPSATPLTPEATRVLGIPSIGARDNFGLSQSGVTVSPSTLFTFVLTPSSGSPVTYTQACNSSITTESIFITGLQGQTLADAHLDSPLSFGWTLPKTFAVANVKVDPMVSTGPSSDPSSVTCHPLPATPILGPGPTTSQVTFPSTCNGKPVVSARVCVGVDGVNGERTEAWYSYE